MSEGILQIKSLYIQKLHEAEYWQERCELAESQLQAFWSGCPSENSSLQEHLLAQWGRERLSRLASRPALLSKEVSQ